MSPGAKNVAAELEVKELMLKRGNIKRSLTASEKLTSRSDLASLDLEERLINHRKLWSEFEIVQSQLDLINSGTPELVARHEHERDSFEDRYYAISAFFKKSISQNSAISGGPTISVASGHNSSAELTSHSGNNDNANLHSRLPFLSLPTFTGTYETWLGFYDTFKALVDDRTDIKDVEKLVHLKGCLQEGAAEVIASIETSSDNYKVAWKLLKERYENKKLIIESHAKSLMDLQPMSKEFSVRILLDRVQKHIRALRALGEPVDSWDTLLILIIKSKLSFQLREKWEDFSSEMKTPTMKQLLEFLQRRAQFEESQFSQSSAKPQKKFENRPDNGRSVNNFKKSYQHAHLASTSKFSCYYCSEEHTIYTCEKFLRLSQKERQEAVKKASLCTNCLCPNHRVSECRGGPCRKCGKRHNSLLHIDRENADNEEKSNAKNSSVNMHTVQDESDAYMVLSTAVVDIFDNAGNSHTCRVLLDNGSQSNYMTEKLASLLNVPKYPVDIDVSGLNSASTEVKHSVVASIKSRFNNYKKTLNFLLVKQVTKKLPAIPLDRTSFQIPSNIYLADPEFYKCREIDALLGVQQFYRLLCTGQIHVKGQETILQKTKLGWVVSATIYPRATQPKEVVCHISQTEVDSLSDQLERFWEIELVPSSKHLSKEEKDCEDHFKLHKTRSKTGRYIVSLPFNEKKKDIGDSYQTALRRFHALESKFAKHPALKEKYSEFMQEYLNLGHMCTTQDNDPKHHGFFLPHHAVIKEDNLTTKIRVVFDGSAKSSSGISLNDALMVGPTVQDDLVTIYTRFRSFSFALTADIEKMYRQVEVTPEDSSYQRILWRENSSEPIKIYNLKTVTYGTASAPFLATRVLSQLSEDEGSSHPFAAQVLNRDFYVDDLLTGAATFQEALDLRNDLVQLVGKGGLTLRKWASNDPRLTRDFNDESKIELLSLDSSNTIKTLGLCWNSKEDAILYAVKNLQNHDRLTKRVILSEIAKIFDPLGLLGPITLHGRILIQTLWKLQITWDELLPEGIQSEWLFFQKQLPRVNQLRFNRCVIIRDAIDVQLHGFCDASEKGYGACIYVRSTDKQGQHYSSLVCSKSRVAPIQKLTIPRLELCGALLLSRLYEVTFSALKHIEFSQTILWSDSTIALHWLNTPPYTLKTFEANRVAKIQEITKNVANITWRHVRTEDNPADLCSRGQLPDKFISEIEFWQRGPCWLTQNETRWPDFKLNKGKPSEISSIPSQVAMTITSLNKRNASDNVDESEAIFKRFSSLKALIRVLAYCFRFYHRIKKDDSIKLTGELSEKEIKLSKDCIMRLTQATSFSKEIDNLSHKGIVNSRSKILNLNPFLDKGILKVGGRLTKADLPYNQKHPILLPRKHHVTELIIRDNHLASMHSGVQATLYSVREQYWPIDGRNITRRIIHNCVKCCRLKPREINQQMGNLPADRLEYSRPFLNVGVDYCGPFYIKERRYRNVKKIKTYVSVFVCLATKAVHLELASDLTTEAFLGCLKRFISRRGKPEKIRSDNGTNFRGASKQLQELEQLVNTTTHNTRVKGYLEGQGIRWSFTPPATPHFGGLWEAAVKSFKHHFLRTAGDTVLTFEQLHTYVNEIEAILNSRPLSPMSSDPNDLRPLTPGHFLIGGPLTSFPQEDRRDERSARLSSWQHAQQMRQHFWRRWHKEYLNELTVRSKWHSGSANIAIGSVVLIKEDNAPPLQWKLARVIDTYPGNDGIVRVVSVKTTDGIYKRCVKKLCPLPVDTPHV